MSKKMRLSLTSDLRGRQSVRATFKLSSRAINAMSIVSMHLGIKQKSLFDHLLEDIQTLNSIAEEISRSSYKQQERVQKTFVLSRKALLSLDDVAKSYGAPRDALVEFSISRLEEIIENERMKHEKRIKLHKEINDLWAKKRNLFEKTLKQLGDDDPLTIYYSNTINNERQTQSQIDDFMIKSKIIEEF
jgi:hypothetical protein